MKRKKGPSIIKRPRSIKGSKPIKHFTRQNNGVKESISSAHHRRVAFQRKKILQLLHAHTRLIRLLRQRVVKLGVQSKELNPHTHASGKESVGKKVAHPYAKSRKMKEYPLPNPSPVPTVTIIPPNKNTEIPLKKEIREIRQKLNPFVRKTPSRVRWIATRYVKLAEQLARERRNPEWKNDAEIQILYRHLQIECIQGLLQLAQRK